MVLYDVSGSAFFGVPFCPRAERYSVTSVTSLWCCMTSIDQRIVDVYVGHELKETVPSVCCDVIVVLHGVTG